MRRYRRADPWTKTVEIPLSELPPPPNAKEKVIDCLQRAAEWATELDMATVDAVSSLIGRITKRAA